MKIIIETVDNGIVETIVDQNYDGAGKVFEHKKIFKITDSVEDTENFIKALIDDLGLYTGGLADKYNLSIDRYFGQNYIPTKEDKQDVTNECKKLAMKINKLKSYK